MVKQEVLLLSVIIIACNYHTLVKGDTPCKKIDVGGLVCLSYIRRLDDRSVYEFKHLSCAQTNVQGHKKILKGKPGHITVKQGHAMQKRKLGEDKALRLEYVIKRIQSSVMASCLRQSGESVTHNSQRNKITIQAVARKGYKKLGSGKDTMYVKRHENKRSWNEAARVCHSEKARLAKIDSEQKWKEIKSKVSEPSDQFKKFYMWIGLKDFERNNTFTWVDGSPLEFSNWYGGQATHTMQIPNGSVVDEDCVALVRYVFKGLYWNDRICSNKNGFICEIVLS